MANDGKVVSLAAAGTPDQLAVAIAEMRARLPGMIEYNRMMARVQREAYLAYVKEGFTAAQALELAKQARP